MIGIYKITNPLGHVYIGQSKDIEKRFKEHKFKSNNKFLRESIKTYGVENHIFEIIEECNECDLIEKERFYIKLFGKKGVILNENTVNHVQYKRNVPFWMVAELDKQLNELKKEKELEKTTKNNLS